MAITVTKHGIIPSERRYLGRCTQCGTEVECTEADTTARNGRAGLYRYIKCPVCSYSHLYVTRKGHDVDPY